MTEPGDKAEQFKDDNDRLDQGLGAGGQGVTYANFSQENLRGLLNRLSNVVPDSLVAQCCGVHRAVIRRWRDGQSMPRDFQRTYLTLRGMEVEWLLPGEETGPAMSGTGV